MAFIQAEIKLSSIARTIQTHLYFPTDLPEIVGNKINGVITLLHGLSNTGADWMYMTAAARYAADNGYVLVAPCADNSFYTDMSYGSPFFTAITQDLPAQLNHIFKLPQGRENNFIAGLSMGGYGALKIGLSAPQNYAAIGSFSGALDLKSVLGLANETPLVNAIFKPVFGENLTLNDDADLFKLAQKVSHLPKEKQPKIFCTCGKQDNEAQVYAQNQSFKALAQTLNLNYTYAEWDGVHEWNFWDRSLAEFIGFIKNNNYAAVKRSDWGANYSK